MIKTITKTEIEPGVFVVQRIKDGVYQVLQETVSSAGETTDKENENLTTETITITRRIGVNQDF